MGLADLAAHVASAGGLREVVQTVLLADDLVQREALLAGEIETVTPAVLTAAQARNEAPLPGYLAGEEGERERRIAADAVWENYYRRAAAVARRRRSRFLREWVRYDLSLRNALAAARAKALGLEPADYLVAQELGGPPEAAAPLVSEWAAGDPLAGLKALDAARWAWLVEHERWYSFAADEVAAYAAKLMLLERWRRITAAESGPPRQAAARAL